MDKILSISKQTNSRLKQKDRSSISTATIIVLILIYCRIFFIGSVRIRLENIFESLGVTIFPDSIVPIFGLVVGALIIIIRRKFYYTKELNFYLINSFFLTSLFFLGCIIQGNLPKGFVWISILTINACILLYATLSLKEKADALRLIVLIFFLYLIGNLVYWGIFLHPFKMGTHDLPYLRMGGTLGGIVYLGYLIPGVCALFIFFSKQFWFNMRIIEPFVIILSVMAILANGSRGGIILMGLLLGFLIFSSNIKYKIVRGISLLIIAIGIFISLTYEVSVYRFYYWELTDWRIVSWVNNIKYWSNLGLQEMIFGVGWNKVYPYLEWLKEGGPTWDRKNLFILQNNESLVSPHSNLIWFLIEGGILITISFLVLIIYPLIKIYKTRQFRFKWLLLYSGMTIVVLFLVDDVFFNAPGTAFFSYMLLLLISNASIGVYDFSRFSRNSNLGHFGGWPAKGG